ncbi:MAG: hypothetical protein KGM99_15410 [Burkholderiales bacterium]|nr:hypothetical protein [Burkholderiales bacterium]
MDINKRFEMVEQTVSMLVGKKVNSVILAGEGGLGKTHTVMATLANSGVADEVHGEAIAFSNLPDMLCKTWDKSWRAANRAWEKQRKFVTIKGVSTSKGLYMSLYEHNGKIIVFDDCDDVLDDKKSNSKSIDLLKNALDTYDTRTLNWNADMRGKDAPPKVFEFTGQVIFITNKNLNDIPQPLRTRSLVIDLSMTPQEKIDRMRHIVTQKEFMPKYSTEMKQTAVNWLDHNKADIKDLSMRVLIMAIKLFAEAKGKESQLIKYTLLNN